MLLHAERHGHRRLFVSLDLSDDVQVPLPFTHSQIECSEPCSQV